MSDRHPAYRNYDGGLVPRRYAHEVEIPKNTDSRSADVLDAANWCIEHVSDGAWTWGWKVTAGKIDISRSVFTFAAADVAALFRLTWV